jgi:hypothetical protein
MSAPYQTDCDWCGKSFGLHTMPIGKNFCSKKCESEYRESKATKSSSGSSGCFSASVIILITTISRIWI